MGGVAPNTRNRVVQDGDQGVERPIVGQVVDELDTPPANLGALVMEPVDERLHCLARRARLSQLGRSYAASELANHVHTLSGHAQQLHEIVLTHANTLGHRPTPPTGHNCRSGTRTGVP